MDIIPFRLLPKFMKDKKAEELKSLIVFVINLKKTKEVSSTYLLLESPELYLDFVDKDAEDYDFVPVSSSYSGYPANSWDYDLLESIEGSVNKDRRTFEKLFKGEKYPEVKLFEGGGYPDIDSLLAKEDLIADAKVLEAEVVVDVKPQYTDAFFRHAVYLDAIALVPRSECGSG
ncbi:hypothetical protein GQ472_04170 [archaeon]|nr:hypothetical protein [archaeon]